MSDPLQAMLDAGVLDTSPFPPNSRYHGVAIATLQQAHQAPLAYLKRRFVPPPDNFSVVQRHTVVQGDRRGGRAARGRGGPGGGGRGGGADGAGRPGGRTE